MLRMYFLQSDLILFPYLSHVSIVFLLSFGAIVETEPLCTAAGLGDLFDVLIYSALSEAFQATL